MPIYEYRCRNGHNFEVLQSMSDDPVTKCEVCGAPFERYANGLKGIRRFCSDAHRQWAYYRARREPRPAETACLRCGKPVLQGSLGRVRRYCTRSCRQLAWVARRRAQARETPASEMT